MSDLMHSTSDTSTSGAGRPYPHQRRRSRPRNRAAEAAGLAHISQNAADGGPSLGLRQMPASLESERALLGALLIGDRAAVEEAMTLVTPADFSRELHGRFFEAVAELARRGDPVDVVAVKDELARRPAGPLFPDMTLLAEMGGGDEREGVFCLMQLADYVPTAANVGYYAAQVRDKALLRRLITTATEIAGIAYADPADVGAAVEEAERKVFALRPQGGVGGRNTAALLSDILHAELHDLGSEPPPGGLSGLSTGFPTLDVYTAGLQPGDYILLAARPSVGKSVLASCLAVNMIRATDPENGGSGGGGVLFALEMNHKQVAQRVIAAEGRVDMQAIRLRETAHRSAAAVYHLLGPGRRLLVDDNTGATVPYMRSVCRRHAAANGGKLAFIVVDYVQLMCQGAEENRNIELSMISRGLKLLANEFRCPVIVLSQLSREVEKRENKRPTLSDLRDSGALEQDADLVWFLYRASVYDKDESGQVRELEPYYLDETELIIAKQRQGPKGTVRLGFTPAYVRFDELDTHHQEPGQ
jgi:replicative DNA helicase